MSGQYKHGYIFNINGVKLLAICAKRASGYALASAIVKAININTELLCTASVGRNNDVDIVGQNTAIHNIDIEINFDTEATNHAENKVPDNMPCMNINCGMWTEVFKNRCGAYQSLLSGSFDMCHLFTITKPPSIAHHNLIKARLLKMIRIHTVPDDYDLEDQKKWLADYLKREGLEFLMEGEKCGKYKCKWIGNKDECPIEYGDKCMAFIKP